MAKLTKAKARKRLLEAQAKFRTVYMSDYGLGGTYEAVGPKDMEAISKIVKRCLNRIR